MFVGACRTHSRASSKPGSCALRRWSAATTERVFQSHPLNKSERLCSSTTPALANVCWERSSTAGEYGCVDGVATESEQSHDCSMHGKKHWRSLFRASPPAANSKTSTHPCSRFGPVRIGRPLTIVSHLNGYSDFSTRGFVLHDLGVTSILNAE